jgi:hemerythrin superfamily protein
LRLGERPKEDAMDVLEFLEQQHDEAKQVFKQLEKAEGDQAGRLWTRLRDMLTLHEKLEETHFYPQLRSDPNARDIVLEAYQEHHVMDVLIGEISQFEPSDEQWAPKIKVLQENTEHHIEEEEGELFPKVRKIWDKSRREEVGRQMQQMKQQQHKEQRAA